MNREFNDDAANPLLRAILESATDYAIITTDLDGRITSWNPGARNVLGWDEAEVLGKQLGLIFTEEDNHASIPEAERARAIENGRAASARWHLRKDGSRFWATGELMPLRHGRLQGFLKILRDRTQERDDREALKKRESLTSAILEGALDCIITIDASSQVVEWNTIAEQTFGYLRDAAIGRELANLIIPPELRASHRRGMARYLATGHGPLLGQRVEVQAIRRDGSRFPVELAISPIQLDGTPHFAARLRDISERQRSEAALRESEERFRLATEAFQGGVADYDIVAGKVTRTKRQLEIIGEEPDTFSPSPEAWVERIHADDRRGFVEARQQVIEQDASQFEAEYRVQHRNGRWLWVWHRGMAMRDSSGKLNRIISSLIEITSRKQGETALRESEARFRHLADSAPALIWLTDETGRLTFANMHFDHVFGRPAASFVPKGWRDLIHADDLAGFVGEFINAFKKRAAFKMDVRVLDKTAKVRWLRTEGVPRLNDEGSFLGYTGCALDVTDAKVAQEHQALLINELNHRVKNTLSTVQSIVGQTLRKTATADQARSDIEARLVALSRAHDVLTRENWEGANLREIVAQAIEPYQGGGKNRFRVEGPQLRLTPRLSLAIAMALHELATNAVKYGALSDDAGQIEIRWSGHQWAGTPKLQLLWSEVGGPPVEPPQRRGFGTTLIERSFSYDVDGKATLSFEPSGLLCTIDASLHGWGDQA